MGREISEEEGDKRLTPSSTICVGAGGGENISVLVSVDVPLVTLTSRRASLLSDAINSRQETVIISRGCGKATVEEDRSYSQFLLQLW